jgi:hypothetical protein
MTTSDWENLAIETGKIVKAYFEQSVEPLLKRIDELERRLIDLDRRNVELKTPAAIFGKGAK